MAISKVIFNGDVLMDVTSDTVSADNLMSGYTAHDKSGALITGTAAGGVVEASDNDVVFYDYDGTRAYSYTADEFLALSNLPENPSHDGLVAQGWNWTLEDAQEYVEEYGKLIVGQMYITESGDTEIDVRFVDDLRLSPVLTIAVNGTVTVDWGDGSEPSTVTGTSLTAIYSASHTYGQSGDYTIKIHVDSGEFTFYSDINGAQYALLRKNTNAVENHVYASTIQAIRLGRGISVIGLHGLQLCRNLKYITIPQGITKIDSYALKQCLSLALIVIPKGVTTIGQDVFSSCFHLISVVIPNNVTGIYGSTFYNNYSFTSIIIPKGITSIESQLLGSCFTLQFVIIPKGVKSIGSSAFSFCYTLHTITIPDSVTTIGNYAFSSCSGLAEMHFKPTTPPVLSGNSVFQNIPSDCAIYVPYSEDHTILNKYKTETNWSVYESQLQEEPQS